MSERWKDSDKIVRPLIDPWERKRPRISGDNPFSPSTSGNTPLEFETLESRLLSAADPLGTTAGYAFDEVSGTAAADASGHAIVGTLTNGPTFAAGKYGNAVNLDGVNDSVNSMTLSAWVNASSFPVDDAAVISPSRGSGESSFQLDLTKDTGPRTIGFKLTPPSGGQMFRYGATTLQPNTWYHIAGVYNATTQTVDVYLNGALDNGVLQGTVTSSPQNSTLNVTVGRRSGSTGHEFSGRIDNLRIYNSALTKAQITADMGTPVGAFKAANQAVASTNFAPLSDRSAQQDTTIVPSTAQTITASYAVSTPLAFVQVNAATPQSNQSQVAVTYTNAQMAGNINILAIGWKNTTSNITSVTDAAGNTYQLAGPTAHGQGISQAIYYAKNVKAAGAGTNTVMVTFNTATPFVDIRATEYGGLDPGNPLDVIRSAWGTSATANSGAITTTAPGELIFAAGMTTGGFSAEGAGFTSRIITTPNLDIAQDRFVTTTGSYRGIASLARSAAWVMQVVAFKVANQTVA